MKKRNIIVAGFIILSFFIGSLFPIPEEISIAIIVILSFILLHEFKVSMLHKEARKKEGR